MRTALHDAAESGNELQVTRLLEEHPEVIDTVTATGETALHCAAKNGNESIVAQLLARRPLLVDEWSRNENKTALHIAASKGHDKLVTQLLAHEDRLCAMAEQRSPTSFLEAGALLNYNALHYAAEAGSERILAELLARCPTLINTLTWRNETALHLAVKHGREQAVKELLSHNAPDITAAGGWTAMHHAAHAGNENIIDQLIQAMGVETLDMHTADGSTTLNIAASAGHEKVVAQLIARRPHLVETLDRNRRTALHCAAREGNQQVIEVLLLEPGAPEFTCCLIDADGNTVLHLVASGGPISTLSPKNCEVIKPHLIEKVWQFNKGALFIKNKRERTPFHLALQTNNLRAIEMFQWQLSLDEIQSICSEMRAPLPESLEPAIDQQIFDVLAPVLLPDIVGTIYEYLRLRHDTHKSKKRKM